MGSTRIRFYQTHNGPCPYRSSGDWNNLAFQTQSLSEDAYGSLLDLGFRRSGFSVYHPICSGCSSCIPIRVRTDTFILSKSQRRTWQKNQDLRVEHHPPAFCQPGFELYSKYQQNWHHCGTPVTESDYQDFLIHSPVKTEMLYYYDQERLLAIGWIDILPKMLSSVYFIFDPDEAPRRLGIFSLLYEIEYASRLEKPWLYLGYWVEDSQKMSYKSDFQPAELLFNKKWVPFHQHPELFASQDVSN